MHRILVYGTLMSGQPNHRLMTTARFVRVAWTAAEYTLVSLGAFPGLVEGGRTAVRGEIYEVDGATLATLDRFEGHPHFYRRARVSLQRGRHDAYLLPAHRAAVYAAIDGGDWLQRKLHLF